MTEAAESAEPIPNANHHYIGEFRCGVLHRAEVALIAEQLYRRGVPDIHYAAEVSPRIQHGNVSFVAAEDRNMY